MKNNKVYVTLQNGKQFVGERFGADGEVVGEPAINSRGFVFDFHRDYNREIREVILKAIDSFDLSRGNIDDFKKHIRRNLRNYLMKKTRQSPMIVPVVVEL